MYFVSDERHKHIRYNDYEAAWFKSIWAAWPLSRKFNIRAMRASWPIFPKLNKPFIERA